MDVVCEMIVMIVGLTGNLSRLVSATAVECRIVIKIGRGST